MLTTEHRTNAIPKANSTHRGSETENTASQRNPIWRSLALDSSHLQCKLAVSQADDPHEQEADRVAERIMRMPSSLSGAAEMFNLQSDTSHQAQRKYDGSEEEEKVHCKEQTGNADAASDAPPVVDQALSSPGQPLDRTTQAYFQLRFGNDLGDVRLHTGAEAAASARAIHARAYTAGKHVVFGPGEYAPETTAGQMLLAHELTHVVQQSESSTRVQRQTPGAPSQPQQQQQQAADLMKVYSFGPTGAGRYAQHGRGTIQFDPRAPVDAQGYELVRAGTTAQPILSRFGRWFQLDERQRPLTPPVQNATIRFLTEWTADDGSEYRRTSQTGVGTYYGPGEPLGTTLGSEFIFRNDRPGRLTVVYVLNHESASPLILGHTVHYATDPAAPPGATVLPDHPAAPPPPGADTP